jgi:hypothetical protein
MLNMGGMFRFGISVALTAFALVAWSGAVQAAAEPVVLVEVPGADPESREKMRSAAEDALDSVGVTVPRQLHDPKKEECATADCIAERSKRVGATHVLEIQGSYGNESYKLRLDVRAANGGRILGSESKECEICSARDFLRAIKDRTTTLWMRVAREQASAVPPAAEPSRETKRATAPLIAPPERRAPRMLWQQPLPLVGLGFMLAGVVAMSFGGYYLAVDGELDPSCSNQTAEQCIYEPRRTKHLGWQLLAGGGGAIVAGTALVIFGRDSDTSPSVAIGPGRVLVSGRF